MVLVKNNQTAMLQEAWRQAAALRGKALEFNFPTPQAAQRGKFALYNAVRGVKEGTREVDMALAEAVANCQVRVPRGSCVLYLERRDASEVMRGFAAGLGLEPGAQVPDATERLIEEMNARRIAEAQGEAAQEPEVMGKALETAKKWGVRR